MKKISILLSTYNGEKYLKEQLNSLFNQTYSGDIIIVARDDGSSDNTINILKSYDIQIIEAKENLGAIASFNALLEYVIKNTNSEYFMFCDQDDVWLKDKIEKTLKKMKELETKFGDIPLLVHTDLEVVDENLQTIDKSFWHFEHISPNINDFNRLLIQNTITGCTIMINRKLAEFAIPIPSNAIMHDWWLGLVVSQFGKIDFVDEALIKYRQHEKNFVGASGFSFKYIVQKIIKNNILQQNYIQAKAFLEMYKKNLDKKTIEILKDFINLKSKSFLQKRKILLKYKLLKQSCIKNLGLLCKI